MSTLSEEFDKEEDLSKAFDQEPSAGAPHGTTANSPLDRALREQPEAQVVNVTDPIEGDLGQFTRDGKRVMNADDMRNVRADFDSRMKLDTQQALRSFLSGGGPFLDEIAGAKAAGASTLDVARKALSGNFEARNPLDVYRGARDAQRTETRQAQQRFPGTAIAGQVAATLPAGAAGAGRGLAGRVLSQAAANAAVMGANEAGASELDATQGQGGDLSRRVLESMAMGGTIGAAGELGASALGAGSRYLGGKASAAVDALRTQIQRAREKAVNSARGTLGGVIAGQNNIADTLRGVASQPHFFRPQVVADATKALASPEGETLMNRSVSNNIEKLGDALTRETPAREAFKEAIDAAKPPAIEAEMARRLNPGNVVRDVGGKAMSSIGQRAALGGIGAGIGYLLGDTAGAGMGAGMGYIAPGALQFMRNTVKNPANQATVFRAGASALGALEPVPRYGSVIMDALAADPQQKPMVPADNYVMQRQQAARPKEDRDEEAINAFLAGG